MIKKISVLACSMLLAFGSITVEAQSKSKVKTIYVNDQWVDCTGETPTKCLEVKTSDKAPWTLYSSTITGFDYEEGYTYKLHVREKKVKNSPANAPNTTWSLVKILKKEKAAEKDATSEALNGKWMVAKLFSRQKEITIPAPKNTYVRWKLDKKEKTFSAKAGCNNIFGRMQTLDQEKIKFGFIAATKMYCEGRMEAEDALIKALEKTTDYQIQENTLKLFHNKGHLLLELQKEKEEQAKEKKSSSLSD